MIFEDAFFRDTAIEIAATPRIRAKMLIASKAEKIFLFILYKYNIFIIE